MAVNLIKLCVGVETVEQLQKHITLRTNILRAAKQPLAMVHTTRMTPKRADEIIGKGSLYWVIKSRVQCRQEIIDLQIYNDEHGVSYCDIVMKPKLILTAHQPKRPFQGWRYFKAEDAPRDLGEGEQAITQMPEELRAELASLGLL
ncbi:MAG: DUF1489 domain-containing protein [Ahrensia sp.]|nr:DUF1489 domain-containing protein [Ahrensia sp.]